MKREVGTALPGGQLVSAHLAQLLFIQILRAHVKTPDQAPAGWLRGLADERVAPALRLMHGEPARAWTLEQLAKACAMSRTTFAFHFRTIAGVAPLTYLAQWRMRLAERALREGTQSIGFIGQSVGYASESAFSNAFKRSSGQSPQAFRRATAERDSVES
ncbi:AraC family transcriptional regulator [Dyella sp. C11]|uniref:helix-turn-helix transcriptional regulator n=1 Tax=Dyella sp. C11 TaxID=2126991 RepID=UPI0018E57932|nr:AraC family transcriptional regulator [Dyella sp. C11]